MEDLSLHILDIAENSLNAGAQNIRVLLIEKNETLILEIDDDGRGMNEDILSKANDPFFTTKEGKKIGLGLAFLSQAAEETGGNLKIERRAEKGIRITACFNKNNIDMKPLGDIKKTMRVLKASHPEVNFVFEHIVEQGDPA
ncbi:MAG: ATP-binding protein [Bacteroidetes bacterium]|nr:ATP-binding protein [Bacteroidota bacterium]